MRLLSIFAVSVFFALGFWACNKTDDTPTPVTPPVVKPDQNLWLLVDGKQLVRINAMNSATATETVNITGLPANETLMAIDFRPATGELYGVSTASRLYIVNQTTGTARVIGAATLSPAIDGAAVGLDFNPTVDRIRLVTNKGQNLRLHPETGGVVATDGVINGGMNPTIQAVAYTNNQAGVTTTVMYDIDPATDKLYKQDPPNNGTLVEVGALGMDITAAAGFDIAPTTDLALAAVQIAGKWELHEINLSTGKLTKLGDLPTGNINGLAIPTAPVAYAIDEANNNLLIFNIASAGFPTSKAITGLQTDETIVGIDMRPLNGQLYALGSTSRLYTLNTSNGAATIVGTAPLATRLSGSSFGFDFNPTVDRIRVVSNTGQNLRLHPDLGTVVAVDGNLNPGTPAVTAVAYTNNVAGATTTTMLDIDSATDRLLRQDPPNNGTVVELGALGINIEAANGFDITSRGGVGYAILRVGTQNALYTINITTGVATKVVDFPTTVRGLAFGTGF
jgi:Domain of unknown function (DUF4394)